MRERADIMERAVSTALLLVLLSTCRNVEGEYVSSGA